MALLEIQVVVIQDEVTDLETDVDFLFDEQIIQDERLFQLETESGEIQDDIVSKFRKVPDSIYENLDKRFWFFLKLQNIPTVIVITILSHDRSAGEHP